MENKKTKQQIFCSKDHKRVATNYKIGFDNRMLLKAKNRKNYQNREVNEFEQLPLYFEKSVLDHTSAPIAPAPKYRMTAETVKIKK